MNKRVKATIKNFCPFCQIDGEPSKKFSYADGLDVVNGPWIGLSRYFDINGKPYLMATAEEDTDRYYFKYCPECGRKIEE